MKKISHHHSQDPGLFYFEEFVDPGHRKMPENPCFQILFEHTIADRNSFLEIVNSF